MVKSLLQHPKIDVNKKNNRGETALYWASYWLLEEMNDILSKVILIYLQLSNLTINNNNLWNKSSNHNK